MAEINQLIPQAELEGLSRRDRKKQESRWRIFEAAMTLMNKQGFDAVTIEEICEAADVSTPLFFHHFSNKAALIRAYMDRLAMEIRLKLASSPEASSVEKLDIINREVIRSAKDSVAFTPQLLTEMFKGKNLDIEHVDRGITGALAQIIAEGQEAGEFSKSWHSEVVAINLIGAWLLLPLAAQGKDFPKNSYEEVLDLTKSGLKSSR